MEATENKEVATSEATILFNQQGIKAAVINEHGIYVHYVDGAAPLHLSKENVLYEFYNKQFSANVVEHLSSLIEKPSEGLKLADSESE